MENYLKQKRSFQAAGNGVHCDGQMQQNAGSMMYQEFKQTNHLDLDHMDVRRLYEEIRSLKSELTIIKNNVAPSTKSESYIAVKSNTKTETALANTPLQRLDVTAAVPEIGATRQTDNENESHIALTRFGQLLKGQDGPRTQDSMMAGESEGFPPANPARQIRGKKFKTRLRKGPAVPNPLCNASPKVPTKKQQELPSRIDNVVHPKNTPSQTSEHLKRSNVAYKLPASAVIIPKMAAIPNKIEESSSFITGNRKKPQQPKHRDQKKTQRYSGKDDKPSILTKPRKRQEKKPEVKKEVKPERPSDFTQMSLPCQNGLICPPRGRKAVALAPEGGIKAYQRSESSKELK